MRHTVLRVFLAMALFGVWLGLQPNKPAQAKTEEAKVGSLVVDMVRENEAILSYEPPEAVPSSHSIELILPAGLTSTVPIQNMNCNLLACTGTISLPAGKVLFYSNVTDVTAKSNRFGVDRPAVIPMCGCWKGPVVYTVPDFVTQMSQDQLRMAMNSSPDDGAFVDLQIDEGGNFSATNYPNQDAFNRGQGDGVGALFGFRQITGTNNVPMAEFDLAGLTAAGWFKESQQLDFGATSQISHTGNATIVGTGGSPTSTFTLTAQIKSLDLGQYQNAYFNDAVRSIAWQISQTVNAPSPTLVFSVTQTPGSIVVRWVVKNGPLDPNIASYKVYRNGLSWDGKVYDMELDKFGYELVDTNADRAQPNCYRLTAILKNSHEDGVAAELCVPPWLNIKTWMPLLRR